MGAKRHEEGHGGLGRGPLQSDEVKKRNEEDSRKRGGGCRYFECTGATTTVSAVQRDVKQYNWQGTPSLLRSLRPKSQGNGTEVAMGPHHAAHQIYRTCGQGLTLCCIENATQKPVVVLAQAQVF